MASILADIGTTIGGYLKAIHDRLDALEALHANAGWPDEPLVAPSAATATVNLPAVLFAPSAATATVSTPAVLFAPSAATHSITLDPVLFAPTGATATVNLGGGSTTHSGEASASMAFSLSADGETSSTHSGEASASMAFTISATGEVESPPPATVTVSGGDISTHDGAYTYDSSNEWYDQDSYSGGGEAGRIWKDTNYTTGVSSGEEGWVHGDVIGMPESFFKTSIEDGQGVTGTMTSFANDPTDGSVIT